MVAYFRELTKRNWGAPWHFIIACLVTQLFIVVFSVSNFDGLAMRIYTVLAFFTAFGYEIYQIRKRGESWRGVAEDMLANLAGYLTAVWPLLTSSPGELALFSAASLLAIKGDRLKVAVDPGHGGTDAGKVAGNLKEKEITLTAGKLLTKALGELGIETALTRAEDEDVDHFLRSSIAHKHQADLLISLHCSSAVFGNERGVRVYWYRKHDGPLAHQVLQALLEAHGGPSQWSYEAFGQDFIIRMTSMAALIVHVGYLGSALEHPLDDEEHLEKLMRALAKEIHRLAPGEAVQRKPAKKRKSLTKKGR